MGGPVNVALYLIALVASFRQDAESVYTDEEKGFSIPIPKGWSLNRSADPSKCLVLRAPAETRSGATLILAVQDPMKAIADGTLSLDVFVEEVKKQYPKKFTEFEWINAVKGKEGDTVTLTLYYRYKSGASRIGQLQHLVWTRGNHYSLSWGCLDDAFEKQKETFERCSKAFRPKK
jgi:hypothetical protein